MKKSVVLPVAVFALSGALPAFAGPDWQIIEQARRAKQAPPQVQRSDAAEASAPFATQVAKCPPEKLVLPLDHGPRAQTTPYLNRSRTEQYEALVAACANAEK